MKHNMEVVHETVREEKQTRGWDLVRQRRVLCGGRDIGGGFGDEWGQGGAAGQTNHHTQPLLRISVAG